MNKGLIPTGTNRQEIELMSQTRNILNALDGPTNAVGAYTGQRLHENKQSRQQKTYKPITPTYIADDSQQGVDAMRNILESLNGVFGSDTSTLTKNDIVNNSIQENVQYSSDDQNWEVVVSLSESGMRIYEVKNSNRNIFQNHKFNVFESAYAVSKILNNNKSQRRISDLIELDEDFNAYKIEAQRSKKNYNSSLKINESEAANVYEKRYKKAQASLTAIHESIKDILKTI